MSREEIFDTLEEFMEALTNLNISKVAFSEVKERRAEQTKVDLLEVVVVRKVDVLSYKDAVIYKFHDQGERIETHFNALIDRGFEVKRISKNIT